MQYVIKIDDELNNSMRIQGIREKDIEPVIFRLKCDIVRDKDFQYGEFIYEFGKDSKNYAIYGLLKENNTINLNKVIKVL